MISDETAYRRYLGGDESAADLLVARHGTALTLYLNGYTRDFHDAEDLMIEAFASIFAKERPLRDAGSFRAYLYKTGRNLALRHRRRAPLSPLRLEDLGFEPSGEDLVEADFDRDERHRLVLAALEELKPEYREALYLVYFEDMTYRQAAEVMGRSENRVSKLIRRGKQQLRPLLEQVGLDEGGAS